VSEEVYKDEAPGEGSVPLPGDWQMLESFGDGSAVLVDATLTLQTGGDFSGAVFLLKRR
jgi:hypothetical protein